MNVLMLDEKRVMCNKTETSTIKMFEKLGKNYAQSFLKFKYKTFGLISLLLYSSNNFSN